MIESRSFGNSHQRRTSYRLSHRIFLPANRPTTPPRKRNDYYPRSPCRRLGRVSSPDPPGRASLPSLPSPTSRVGVLERKNPSYQHYVRCNAVSCFFWGSDLKESIIGFKQYNIGIIIVALPDRAAKWRKWNNRQVGTYYRNTCNGSRDDIISRHSVALVVFLHLSFQQAKNKEKAHKV